jgi:hypothetical protein
MSLFCTFALGTLVLLLSILIEIYKKMKHFFDTKEFTIEWYLYIDLAVVGLCSMSVIEWFIIFFTGR